MKTIGLLGGMSWESTLGYYQAINRAIKQRLGGLNSAQIVLNSVNFAPLEALQHQGNWAAIADSLSSAAKLVEAGGADFLLICTNTMHKIYPEIEAGLKIPLLHIADATAKRLEQDGFSKVGLLGTQFTMEQDFYKGRLADKFGIEAIVPEQRDRELVHKVIYQELCQGKISAESKASFVAIIESLTEQGAQSVILGCTEIGLLVQQQDTAVPLLDTTQVHAEAAVDLALGR